MSEDKSEFSQADAARKLAQEAGHDWKEVQKKPDLLQHFLEQACPAGGLKEKEFHADGSRYWQRRQSRRGS